VETGDTLRLADLDLAEVLFDLHAAEHARDHFARPDAHAHHVGACSLGEPPRRDARPVPGHLGTRAIGVPDDDVAVVGNLEDAVSVADLGADALRC
jgi:hypothetical protein